MRQPAALCHSECNMKDIDEATYSIPMSQDTLCSCLQKYVHNALPKEQSTCAVLTCAYVPALHKSQKEMQCLCWNKRAKRCKTHLQAFSNPISGMQSLYCLGMGNPYWGYQWFMAMFRGTRKKWLTMDFRGAVFSRKANFPRCTTVKGNRLWDSNGHIGVKVGNRTNWMDLNGLVLSIARLRQICSRIKLLQI